jgi:type IV pilus assembly protein PilE
MSITVLRLPVRRPGFTLIELLVTVFIISILASIAFPSYTAYLARARRADARTQLVQAAHYMQRFYVANDSYEQDRSGDGVFDKIPGTLKQSPADSTPIYELSIPSGTLTNSGFELRMTPVSTGVMRADECGTFTLSSTGVRGILIDTDAGQASLRDTCWK